MLEKLELKNFAKFAALSIQFSPRINIIIGENEAYFADGQRTDCQMQRCSKQG